VLRTELTCLPQLACGCLFGPALSVVAHWFKRRRSLAFGILAIGSSIGGMIRVRLWFATLRLTAARYRFSNHGAAPRGFHRVRLESACTSVGRVVSFGGSEYCELTYIVLPSLRLLMGDLFW